MKIFNTITFRFENPNNASIFYNSFLPEFEDMPLKRSKWEICHPDQNLNEIIFKIQSEDATAFRATINSLVQFANIVEKTINLTKNL